MGLGLPPLSRTPTLQTASVHHICACLSQGVLCGGRQDGAGTTTLPRDTPAHGKDSLIMCGIIKRHTASAWLGPDP